MLKLQNKRIFMVFFSQLIILFGGYIVYQGYGVERPAERMLGKIPSVQFAEVDPWSHSVLVKLKNVSDLQTTYKDIHQITTQWLGTNNTIEITDTRSERLTNFFKLLQPTLLEDIHKGNYTKMLQFIGNETQHPNILKKITMDTNNVYLQLSDGNGDLYEVIPLTIPKGDPS